MDSAIQPTTRKCSSCRRILDNGFFAINRLGRTMPVCKPCRNQDWRLKYAKRIGYHYNPKKGHARKDDGGVILKLHDQNSHVLGLILKGAPNSQKPMIHIPSREVWTFKLEQLASSVIEMRLIRPDDTYVIYQFSGVQPVLDAIVNILGSLDLRLEYGERNLAVARKMYFG